MRLGIWRRRQLRGRPLAATDDARIARAEAVIAGLPELTREVFFMHRFEDLSSERMHLARHDRDGTAAAPDMVQEVFARMFGSGALDRIDNPESELIRNAVPELRIVSDELWVAVKRQQEIVADRYVGIKEAAQARSLHQARRPAYLLSGLLECGVCGGTYALVVGDRYGCVGRYRSHSCTNGRTIRRAELERRALAGIADRLVSADKIDAAVAAYAAQINGENRERRIQADADVRALAKIDRALAGIMAAIEDGLYRPSMKARMAELEREKQEITARLADTPQHIPNIHPGIAEIYKNKVARLTETLEDPEAQLDASSDIRSLVGKIVLHPGAKRGEVHATLHGSLMGILDFVNDNQQPDGNRVITSVASGSPG